MTNNTSRISREKLMNRIQAVSFALYDTILYLNTHPDDREALAKFNEYNDMRRGLMEEYSSLYGPVNTDFINTDSGTWNWIDAPWPWQEG